MEGIDTGERVEEIGEEETAEEIGTKRRSGGRRYREKWWK